ncbi:hypothetical protein [Polynucleobacter sp. MG-27-Goln-C1]|uniref:hypothetical protein n=1 Tax=Polynucleobacter sp. MG-27-Goln-C1 TaxID=1819726 RepID=UPI001C0D28B1|nr:hypothetical protein [Polynucleobacter sp. MG-27-Goln-C1]MBU3612944.1 hypothetical protein [Polynucleobacter sp. MG-27-Goln-C1]
MEKNKLPNKSVGYTTVEQILNSPDPDIVGSYYAMQRAGQAAIDLAIQTNTAIVTTVDGKIVRIPAAELIKQRQLTV